MPPTMLRIVGMCGSLRAKSMNAALLRYAATTFPSFVRYDEANIGALPLYNEDLEVTGRPPAAVDFAALVGAADGVLFACPEYKSADDTHSTAPRSSVVMTPLSPTSLASHPRSYGYTGVLKNAIDWASRAPKGDKPGSAALINKPWAVMGGSYGMMGSGRAQYPLRQSMLYLGGPGVLKPEIFVRFTDPDLWDDKGELKHPSTQKIIAQLTASLVELVIQHKTREETLQRFKANL